MFRKKAEAQAAAQEAERLRAEIGTVRSVLARYRPGTRLSFGAPTRCPRCGDYGFADRVDRSMGIAHNHCLSCDADWILTKRALTAVERDPSLLDDLYPVDAEPKTASTTISEPTYGGRGTEPHDEPDAPPAPRLLEEAETGWAGANREPEPEKEWRPRDDLATPRPYVGGSSERTRPEPDAPSPEPVEPAPRKRVPRPVQAEPPSTPPTPAPEPEPPAPVAPVVASPPAAVTPAAASGELGLRVLVVEDNPFDMALLEELIDSIEGADIQLLHAPTRADGERIASANAINIVLLDLNLPDSAGIDTLIGWKSSGASSAPVIVMSGSSEADLIQQAREVGAVHYVQKNHLLDLADQGPSGAARLLRILKSTAKNVRSF